MPIDIDEIRKGRRRDWDKLRDPEVRREEKRIAREADPAFKKRRSWFQRRDDDKKEQDEKEQEEFQKAKKRVIWLFVGLIGIFIISSGSNYLASYAAARSRDSKVEELALLVNRDIAYQNFDTPIDAWASWRSAWMRKDAKAIVKTYSKEYIKKARGRLTETTYANNFQREINDGREEVNYLIAREFEEPEIVRYPYFGLKDGTLAVLRSEMQHEERHGGTEASYVLVLAYDDRRDEWRVEDMRNNKVWRDKWDHRNKIPVTRNPDQLRKQEEDNNESWIW